MSSTYRFLLTENRSIRHGVVKGTEFLISHTFHRKRYFYCASIFAEMIPITHKISFRVVFLFYF